MKKKVTKRFCDLVRDDTHGRRVCETETKHRCEVCGRDACDFHIRSLFSRHESGTQYIYDISYIGGTSSSPNEAIHGKICVECIDDLIKELKKKSRKGR
jgi:hypothetical protein